MIARLNRWPKINSLNSYELAHLTDRSPRLVSETHSSVSDGVQRSNFFSGHFCWSPIFVGSGQARIFIWQDAENMTETPFSGISTKNRLPIFYRVGIFFWRKSSGIRAHKRLNVLAFKSLPFKLEPSIGIWILWWSIRPLLAVEKSSTF